MSLVGAASLNHGNISTSPPATPAKRLAPEFYSEVHELRKPRKQRRRVQGLSVLKAVVKPLPEETEGTNVDGTGTTKTPAPSKEQHRRILPRERPVDFAGGYAEDNFRSRTCAKPSMAFADLAASTNSESVTSDLPVSETVTEPRETEPRGNVCVSWLKTPQFCFSLLVSGVGSKRNVLQKVQ